MNQLLSANFMALKKSRLFWVCIAVVILHVIYRVFGLPYAGTGTELNADAVLMEYVYLIGPFAALFCSLFIGQEYHDGVIRNQIMTGHRRRDIYLANQITCMLVIFLMVMLHILTACLVALPIRNWGYDDSYPEIVRTVLWPAPDLSETLQMIFASFFTTAVYCSLCVLIAMSHSNRTFSVISCCGTIYLLNSIGQGIGYYAGGWNGATLWIGGFYPGETDINVLERVPGHLMQFLADFMPGAQAIRIYDHQYDHLPQIMIYSILWVFLLTKLGLRLFFNKNIT